MIGLLYLVFFLIYGWLSIKAVKRTAQWAKGKHKNIWVWGGLAGFVMYLLVFWDWVPTEIMFRYDCSNYAGFTQYKTLEQWKVENPGVAETLQPSKDVKSTREGNRERYVLNQRFAWDIIRTNHPLHIREREEHIIDMKTGVVLARYVDFNTDIRVIGLGTRNIRDYKLWLNYRSCETGNGRRTKPMNYEFNKFMYLVQHQREYKE